MYDGWSSTSSSSPRRVEAGVSSFSDNNDNYESTLPSITEDASGVTKESIAAFALKTGSPVQFDVLHEYVAALFKRQTSHSAFPRRATQRAALILVIGFIHNLGNTTAALSGASSQFATPQQAAKYVIAIAPLLHEISERGRRLLTNIVQHPLHLALAAVLLAYKHRGEMHVTESMVSSFIHTLDEPVRELVGDASEVTVQVQALEILLEQMSARSSMPLALPEHYLRGTLLGFTLILPNVSPPTRASIGKCSLTILEALYESGSGMLLFPSHCAAAVVLVSHALHRVQVPKNAFQDITAKLAAAASNSEALLAVPRLEDAAVAAFVTVIVGKAHARTAGASTVGTTPVQRGIEGVMREAVSAYAPGFFLTQVLA